MSIKTQLVYFHYWLQFWIYLKRRVYPDRLKLKLALNLVFFAVRVIDGFALADSPSQVGFDKRFDFAI